MKGGEILKIARSISLSVGWGTAQQTGDHPAQLLNNQIDSFTWLAVLAEEKEVEQEEEKWSFLLEWLHVKDGHSEMRHLLREGISTGWPVTQRAYETFISACSQFHTRLEKHPLQDPPLHLSTGKGL